MADYHKKMGHALLSQTVNVFIEEKVLLLLPLVLLV